MRSINYFNQRIAHDAITVFRASNLKYIAIQWEKPKSYGSAMITGYRVYVDGICESVNGPDELVFNYTTGKFCTEYSFQVQAITDNDLASKPSDPLLVKWPGVIPPAVRQLPSETNSSLKLGWDVPYCTEGVKVRHYKVWAKFFLYFILKYGTKFSFFHNKFCGI